MIVRNAVVGVPNGVKGVGKRTAADVAQPADAVHAVRLEATVTQHLQDLRILLAVLLEDELSLDVVGLVLSPAPVLATLCISLASYFSLSYFSSLRFFVLVSSASRSGNDGSPQEKKKSA